LNEFFRIPNKLLFFKTLKFNLALLKQCYLKALYLKSIIKAPNQTTIYAYWCDDLATIAAFTKLNTPEVNFISRAHGFDVFEAQSDYKHIFFRSFQLSLMNHLWSVSRLGAAHLKLKNKHYSQKIGVSYLGIESNAQFVFENTSIIRLVTCSRVRSIKRLELLSEALKSTNQPVVWEVIGDGDDLQKLKTLTSTLPKAIQVIFHGNMTSQQIHALYGSKHFDFLVSLSSSEGLPVSMMEAISHGIPILSTDVGGCKEIVTNQTGVLIPANFASEELNKIILNCKSGQFNTVEARQKIIDFWKINFSAENNYKQFATSVLQIK
jgi:glycosyltransferase involved in cell wall biosynthesis